MSDRSEQQSIRDESLRLLKAQEGLLWQEVQGEFHAAYAEFPTWILLYEDSDLRQSHRGFVEIVQGFMDRALPVEFTVSYSLRTAALDITLATMMDNAEVLQALDAADLGAHPDTSLRAPGGVFRAQISGRRPV